MIKVGIAGVPWALKGKGTAEGIKYLATIGLDALEVQFVRRVSMKETTATSVGEVAREANIDLSVHAPYMVNLASENQTTIEESLERIRLSIERGYALGAKIVVFHSAYYSKKYTKDQTFELVKEACTTLLDYMHERGITEPRLGIELLGRQSQFGTVEEVSHLRSEVPELHPVVDFAHLQARCDGCLRTTDDYAQVLRTLFTPRDPIHIHFSGIEYSKGNERRHLPVDLTEFSRLANALLSGSYNATVICESPRLEKDALKMKPLVK